MASWSDWQTRLAQKSSSSSLEAVEARLGDTHPALRVCACTSLCECASGYARAPACLTACTIAMSPVYSITTHARALWGVYEKIGGDCAP
eukprot:5587843-Pleurochrysis_carterae.AAC.1